MKLHEYQGKDILRQFGVNVQDGKVAKTPDEVRQIARDYGQAVVVKAQVHVGGRGKAGGVKFSPDADKAFENGEKILGMDIKGLTVNKVLVTKAVDIDAGVEYYVGMIVDRNVQSFTLMACAEGGMEIEELAAERPEAIIRHRVDPVTGLRPYEAREVALKAGFKGNLNKIADMMVRMSKAAIELDANLVEINPLFVDENGIPVALDTKFDVDDNALFRHPDLSNLRESEADHPLEVEAAKYGFAYVKLDGSTGVLGNGAGIVMTTLDVVNRVGGKPATGDFYQIAQFNLTSPTDGFTAKRDSIGVFSLQFKQWGNWWWLHGMGLGDYQTEQFRFRTDGNGCRVEMKKPPKPGAVFIVAQGDKWEEL